MSSRNQPTTTPSNSNGDFNLSMGDYRPHRGTVSDVVQLILNLLNARRLAGRSSGIPTWENLMAVWRRYGKNQQRAERGTQTPSVATPTMETPTETSLEVKPDDGRALARWAVGATHQDLLQHPLIQIALDRGVVRPPPAAQAGSRRLAKETSTIPTRNIRTVRTKADLKQVRLVPKVADLINLDTDEEEFLQLRVGPQELPDVDMLSGLPDSDDDGL
ncbi:unnamed protein product [Macrosiphum euphorbiae]|uniref:Uncharacterized protein n=1 Tax=Macrosiphum euphorbiae TaxID=13131 RepID=A0AAV0VMA2_9HEMI|nr:unnamed protein product [Macrosiphum euphorbiae]